MSVPWLTLKGIMVMNLKASHCFRMMWPTTALLFSSFELPRHGCPMQEVDIIQSKEVLRERTMAGSKSGKRASGRVAEPADFGYKAFGFMPTQSDN
ncbi:hypothetical protein V6N11_050215 [Hibiscus sabdariffa]|uniref:Uncharacterized protein n=1 Tax=Hibiscus sabdariffa TaxID=183260 RepID=A0ABR2T962_9ROSI